MHFDAFDKGSNAEAKEEGASHKPPGRDHDPASTPGRCILPNSEDSPDLPFRRALIFGLVQAYHHGIRGEDAEDCALSFVAHIVPKIATLAPHQRAVTDAWLNRCAANWTRNMCRGVRRRRHRERLWSEFGGDDSLSEERLVPQEGCLAPPAASSPEAHLFHGELSARVAKAVGHLGPSQAVLFKDYYVSERTVSEIAERSCRTPNAVWQALWALRKRLRILLAEQGIDETGGREYLRLVHNENS